MQEDNKNLATLVYILQALGMLVGISFIAGVIINYIKQDEVKGTLAESHFRWQIRTFWFGLLWGVVGMILLFVVVGAIVLVANVVWVLYRIIKGWLALNSDKPMYVVTSNIASTC